LSDAPEALSDELLLTAIEARVLGCLVEKEATTPEQYPLTENSVLLACNQKTSRDPVMELSAGEVGHALRRMEERRLLRSVHGSRAQRYEHRLADAYAVTRAQQALLALLLLRGPQTAPELLQRCERVQRFADLDELLHTLERLAQRSPALVVRVPRSGGQREDRFMHLLCGAVDVEALREQAAGSPRASLPGRDELLERISALEARIDLLEQRLRHD
jgi:uncharacterized protein YceH (UPF0502 family)